MARLRVERVLDKVHVTSHLEVQPNRHEDIVDVADHVVMCRRHDVVHPAVEGVAEVNVGHPQPMLPLGAQLVLPDCFVALEHIILLQSFCARR